MKRHHRSATTAGSSRGRSVSAAVVMMLISVVAAARVQAAAGADFVRGLAGEPQGGFRQNWHTHLGEVPLFGIRQQRVDGDMKWKTAPLPTSLTGETVTFVWSGAMGMQTASGGGFTLSVNDRDVADFDVVLESTEFPCRSEKCRFLYRVLFTYPALGALPPLDSSGHFFLTVPRAWLKAGEPALMRVKGGEAGSPAWFAVIQKDDAPLAVPNIVWADFRRVQRVAAGTPSRRGEEASYEGYLKQYGDPGIFTPIGPPSDPAETAVSPAWATHVRQRPVSVRDTIRGQRPRLRPGGPGADRPCRDGEAGRAVLGGRLSADRDDELAIRGSGTPGDGFRPAAAGRGLHDRPGKHPGVGRFRRHEPGRDASVRCLPGRPARG